MICRSTSLLLAIAALGSPAAALQIATTSEQTAPATLDRATRARVLDGIVAAIERSYVFPAKRGGIVAALREGQRSGRYDIDDAARFAERITSDLQAAGSDHHLYIDYKPDAYAAALNVAPGSADGITPIDLAEAVRDHHGLAEMRILPGNIRYLRITRFHWAGDATGAAYDDAMRFLRDGDALIIDLRGNPGGSHPAVRYLVSHFLAPDRLEMTFLEAGHEPVQSRSIDYLPAGRIPAKPLYVLIDGNVGSAAEAFAYDVQQFKLGELVGSTTAGAANNNQFVPIAPGFMLSVSFGRPVHAVSGTNWEGVGVVPTIPGAGADALALAQDRALATLDAGAATPAAHAEYAWARTRIAATLHPPRITPAQLRRYAGRYGDVRIALTDGALWMDRADRPRRKLEPLTADGLFAVSGADMLRVRFRTDGLDTLWMGDPEPRHYQRG